MAVYISGKRMLTGKDRSKKYEVKPYEYNYFYKINYIRDNILFLYV
ncbi:Uncharacterized protein dnm_034780 [Desulfonema magnum]|uniref:Uncharacterized protein n=1 Tax=Desulfonema magnum TaxID=45655 RepID=A0A975BLZ7_9BACT|nr:Uncharacterized protein dnm_034780 [Desulfonema magnum]